MNLEEIIKRSAKIVPVLDEGTVDLMKTLIGQESVVVEFDEVTSYEQFRLLVKEGYLDKDYRHYTIKEEGQALVEAYELYKSQPKKFQKILEDKGDKEVVTITYKKHDMKENIICNEVAKFDVEEDGLPVVVVSEDVYANLIHRQKGQHWRQYISEEGRQLVRQKKLARFYVEDETTGRRYLYIVPKN